MKRFFVRLWNHKQAITGTITSTVATLGGAGLISPDLALKVSAITGAVVAVIAVCYSIVQDAP